MPPQNDGSGYESGQGYKAAVPTEYRGHRFRSRVEARWAVFFDVLRVPYEYEPETFDVGGQWYLPDFVIRPDPQHGRVFFEVKGEQPNVEELAKAKGLAAVTKMGVLISMGNFSSGYAAFPHPVMVGIRPSGEMDGLYEWYHCGTCSKVGVKKITDANFGGCTCNYPYRSAILEGAYRAARGQRFGS